MKPRWFSWKPKGLEKFDCRQKYDRAPTPDEVIIAIEVKGKVKGRTGTFAARFLFRREQLKNERPTVDAVMVEAFARRWLGALLPVRQEAEIKNDRPADRSADAFMG